MSDDDDGDDMPQLVASSSSESESDDDGPTNSKRPASTVPPAASSSAAPPSSAAAGGAGPEPETAAAAAPVAPAAAAQAPPVVKPGFLEKKASKDGAAGGAVNGPEARRRRIAKADNRPKNGQMDAELDQVLIALCMRDDSSAINAADRAWPCRRSDLRQLAECLHNGRAWGLAGEREKITDDEEGVVKHLAEHLGKKAKQIPDHERTMAVRALKELVFIHRRGNLLKWDDNDVSLVREDPPETLRPDHDPSLSVSRSQFIREAEKNWNISEVLLEDALILEDHALQSGTVRLQSEEFKAMRWMRLDLLRFWFVESWGPPVCRGVSGYEVTHAPGLSVPFKFLADLRSKFQHDSEVWYRWVRLLLDCGKVLTKDVARQTLQRLWPAPSGTVDLRIGTHGYECFQALFAELNKTDKTGAGKGPISFETREGQHLGLTLSRDGLKGRRISWFDSKLQHRLTGQVHECRPASDQSCRYRLSVLEDTSKELKEIDGPDEQHDMHLVEDELSHARCNYFAPKMSDSGHVDSGAASPAAGPPDEDSMESPPPDISALVGLQELSRMAIEVYDVDVANSAQRLLLELVDIWEEVSGALVAAMHANGGVAVGRLRDATAQQRLSTLSHEIVQRSIIAVRSKRESPVPAAKCAQCHVTLISVGDRAPRVWKDCRQKNSHTFCKSCILQDPTRKEKQCPKCRNKKFAPGSGATAEAFCYEPYGHVQLLMQAEEKDRKRKDDIAMKLIEEEEAAKAAAEKKKKKKKKKAQGAEDASAVSGGVAATAGAPDAANDGDIDDWDAEEADHFCCSISMEIMEDPIFFGDGFSYEKSAIEDWIRLKIGSEPITHKTKVMSPKTGEPVQPVMIPNHNLRQAIQSWKAHKAKLSGDAIEAGAPG